MLCEQQVLHFSCNCILLHIMLSLSGINADTNIWYISFILYALFTPVYATSKLYHGVDDALAPAGAPSLLFVSARPMASLTSGSFLMVLLTNQSFIRPLSSFVPVSSPAKGVISIAISLLASASVVLAMFSNLANCCKSCGELAVVDGGGG